MQTLATDGVTPAAEPPDAELRDNVLIEIWVKTRDQRSLSDRIETVWTAIEPDMRELVPDLIRSKRTSSLVASANGRCFT